jgi:hypothetical protein
VSNSRGVAYQAFDAGCQVDFILSDSFETSFAEKASIYYFPSELFMEKHIRGASFFTRVDICS